MVTLGLEAYVELLGDLLAVETLGERFEYLAFARGKLCYWIYRGVDKALLERGSPNPLYKKWIDTYGGEEFGALVEAVLALTDEIRENLNPAQKARVTEAFTTTSRYEWMFWDAAWRLEEWPLS